MNEKQTFVVKLLQTVVTDDATSLYEAIQALGHGIAVLSTSQGTRERQAEFLEKTFAAIRQDAEETMQHFDAYRMTERPITADAEVEAAKILSKYWSASNNG
ncbi:hypothetical protein [Burkholderia sp. Bp8990]|uniref:hypothetical protein n=1 Tax=Burkholderia sp. Bp8990 TaxID=2184552 RepID=UPI000F5B7292|nr:hypothetical protein [Burkholderia sp. Bp8990]RQS39793.1 hypothetical protein DIE01_16410 [Burkholderia sp. Bp8990]